MIKIKNDKYKPTQIITDDYDNIMFTIIYNGAFINFIADTEYDFTYVTDDESDTIISYLFGIKYRYNYNFNPYIVYDRLRINRSYYVD